MRRALLLSLALVAIPAAAAISDEVPFAAPPAPILGQQSAQVANLGDIMGKIQLRHIKIWYAIKLRNWGLLDYELGQIKDTLNNAVVLYQNIPVELIVAADKPVAAMQKAAEAKDASKLEQDYTALTVACNSCHKAAGAGFIEIKTPTSSPFSDQEFQPKEK